MKMADYCFHGTKTISIGSGKGGVGKTTLLVNLAWSLANQGKKVLIYDADLGLSNAEIMLNAKPRGNILEVLKGEKELKDVVTTLSPQIDLISSGTGLLELQRLNIFERRSLITSFENLDKSYDYLLVDTSPGISDNVLHVSSATQMPVIIITPDPSAITDSYALVKLLHQECRVQKVAIVANQVRDEYDGLSLYQRFADVAGRFLSVNLDFWGSVDYDPSIKRNTIHQRLIVKQEPTGPSSLRINKISQSLQRSLQSETQPPGLSFFLESVVGVA